jgi:hypothetical protein
MTGSPGQNLRAWHTEGARPRDEHPVDTIFLNDGQGPGCDDGDQDSEE